MIAIGLLFALALQDGPKITLSVDATNATKALEQLGAAAHLTLTTSTQTASDILVFKFKDVTVSEAMRQIAAADDASWKQEGDSYRLVRTSEQQRAEREKEFSDDVQKIAKAIQKRTDALKKMAGWSPEQADALASKVATHLKSFNPQAMGGDNWYQQSNTLSEQAPAGRALTQVISTLSPTDLAQLTPQIKAVWSTNPTATQMPMPKEVTGIISDFLKDEADWANAVERWHLKAPTVGNTTYWVGGFGDFSTPAAGSVSVVLLTAQSYNRGASLQFELTAYDSKGKKVAQTQSNLSDDYSRFAEFTKEEQPKPNERMLTPAGDIKTISDAFMTGQNAVSKLPPELLDRLCDVTHNEPLQLFLGSALQQTADIRGVNLAAHLSDSMFYASFGSRGKPMSVDRFLNVISAMGGTCQLKDGWLTVTPQRPAEDREKQVDRKELAKYLQRNRQRKRLTIDEQAAFCLTLPSPEDDGLPDIMANLIKPRDNSVYYDHNMLKMYALMTPEQKSKMMNGGLPCGSLTDAQKQCLNKMIYGQNAFLQYQPPPSPNGDQPDWDLYYNGIYHEPTESLPNGVPPQALVKLDSQDSYVVVTGDRAMPNYTQPGQTLDANSLAWQKYGQDHPDLFPWMEDENQKVDLSRLKYGKHLMMNFTFQFSKFLSLSQSLEDKDMDEFQDVTMAGLPADFKKQFQESYDNYAKSYANVKPGQFGTNKNSNIPPK